MQVVQVAEEVDKISAQTGDEALVPLLSHVLYIEGRGLGVSWMVSPPMQCRILPAWTDSLVLIVKVGGGADRRVYKESALGHLP